MQGDRRTVFVFDMDGTLLPGTNACREIARIRRHGDAVAQLETMLAAGAIDTRAFARAISSMWGPLDDLTLETAFREAPKLLKIAEALAAVRELGGVAILITMSPCVFAERFFELGFDHIFSSHYPRQLDEELNVSAVLTPDDKPRIVKQVCEDLGIEYTNTVAIGDSDSDLPLFRQLTNTIAINASPALKALARFSYTGLDLEEALSPVIGRALPSTRPGPA